MCQRTTDWLSFFLVPPPLFPVFGVSVTNSSRPRTTSSCRRLFCLGTLSCIPPRWLNLLSVSFFAFPSHSFRFPGYRMGATNQACNYKVSAAVSIFRCHYWYFTFQSQALGRQCQNVCAHTLCRHTYIHTSLDGEDGWDRGRTDGRVGPNYEWQASDVHGRVDDS